MSQLYHDERKSFTEYGFLLVFSILGNPSSTAKSTKTISPTFSRLYLTLVKYLDFSVIFLGKTNFHEFLDLADTLLPLVNERAPRDNQPQVDSVSLCRGSEVGQMLIACGNSPARLVQ